LYAIRSDRLERGEECAEQREDETPRCGRVVAVGRKNDTGNDGEEGEVCVPRMAFVEQDRREDDGEEWGHGADDLVELGSARSARTVSWHPPLLLFPPILMPDKKRKKGHKREGRSESKETHGNGDEMQTQVGYGNVDGVQDGERKHRRALLGGQSRLDKEASVQGDLRTDRAAQHLDRREGPWEGEALEDKLVVESEAWIGGRSWLLAHAAGERKQRETEADRG
jgi:hypothetical protein